MFAYQMRELLKERGRLLPVSEASVRPLLEQLREDRQLAKKKLKLDDLRVKAWDDACLMKEKSTPTGTDVSRAVRRLMGPRVDTTTDPAFRAYRRHAHRVKSETAKMIKLMPDLAGSLADNDNKTKRQKKDMAKLLEKQTMWSNQQFLTFDGTWTPNRKLFEEGDYLAALAKAKRLERMVVILRVRDFIHRTGIKVPLPKVNTPAHPLPATAYAESLDMWINRDHH
jgi:hypothetical protein